jgi:hypothetical protein
VLFAAGGAVTGGASLALADDPGKLDPAAAQTLNVLARDLAMILYAGLGLLMLAAGLAIVRSRLLPAWLGWVGIGHCGRSGPRHAATGLQPGANAATTGVLERRCLTSNDHTAPLWLWHSVSRLTDAMSHYRGEAMTRLLYPEQLYEELRQIDLERFLAIFNDEPFVTVNAN